METTKRYTIRVGDQLVITDIDITQRVLPARVQFATILAAVTVEDNEVCIDFEGYEDSGWFDYNDEVAEAKLVLAQEVADMLEVDGVIVEGRPVE